MVSIGDSTAARRVGLKFLEEDMSRWPLLLVALTALEGCIIYETPGKCLDCGDDWVSQPPPDTGYPQPAEEPTVMLSPAEGRVGTSLIAHLTVASGDLDLAQVTGVEFFSGVTIDATENRGGEIILSLSIPNEAVTGPADLLLHLGDSRVILAEDVFTVLGLQEDTTDEPDTGDDGDDTSVGGDTGGTDTGPCE
jgi:hypothetical protein